MVGAHGRQRADHNVTVLDVRRVIEMGLIEHFRELLASKSHETRHGGGVLYVLLRVQQRHVKLWDLVQFISYHRSTKSASDNHHALARPNR